MPSKRVSRRCVCKAIFGDCIECRCFLISYNAFGVCLDDQVKDSDSKKHPRAAQPQDLVDDHCCGDLVKAFLKDVEHHYTDDVYEQVVTLLEVSVMYGLAADRMPTGEALIGKTMCRAFKKELQSK